MKKFRARPKYLYFLFLVCVPLGIIAVLLLGVSSLKEGFEELFGSLLLLILWYLFTAFDYVVIDERNRKLIIREAINRWVINIDDIEQIDSYSSFALIKNAVMKWSIQYRKGDKLSLMSFSSFNYSDKQLREVLDLLKSTNKKIKTDVETEA